MAGPRMNESGFLIPHHSRMVAVCFIALGVLLTIVLLPIAGRPGPALPGIHVLFDAGVGVADFATSAFLWLRFRRSGSGSDLTLTVAYVFSGLMAVAYCLTFPDALIPGRPLIGTSASSSWIFSFWTIGFGVFCFVATVLPTRFAVHRSSGTAINAATIVAGMAVLAISYAFLAFARLPQDRLPVLVVGTHWTIEDLLLSYAASAVMLATIGAILLTPRKHDELLVWLSFALAGIALGNFLSVVGGARYTLGWYTFRLSWLSSSFVLLIYFITQFARQREQLFRAHDDLQKRIRERDRIWSVSEDLLGVSNFEGYLVSVNPAWTQTLGWTEGKIKSMHVSMLRHPDDAEQAVSARARLAEGAQTVRLDNRFRHADGSWRWISWTMSADDGLIYLAGRDVTAEKEAQEAMRTRQAASAHRQKMEALGQLTGGVAHDFNNLLMVVGGHASVLKKSLVADARATKSAEAIDAAVHRGEALTRQLLSFSRRQPINPGIIQIGPRIEALQPMLQSSLGAFATLQLEISQDLWPVKVDLNECELALVNLVLNARDAIARDGTITIKAYNARLEADAAPQDLSGEFVKITVTDTGSGIPPDILPKVFEPFFTTKDIGKGTGLGLSQVHGFAYQSGGAVSIVSELGHGTTVTLYLPRGTAVVERAESPNLQKVPGGKALLVEDNLDVAEITREMLVQMGYEVHVASDARTALRAIAIQDFDLLVSDIVMAGALNGHDLARIVRDQKPQQPIVLVTGYSESAETAMAEFVVLRKPYKSANLLDAINRTTANAPNGLTIPATGTSPPSGAISAGLLDQNSVMPPQSGAANS